MQELTISQAMESLQVLPTSQVLDYFLGQQTPNTAKTYSSAIRAFLALSSLDIKEVSQVHALSYDTYLKDHCSPATRQRHISTLNRFFSFAVKLGTIQSNPFQIVKQQGVKSNVANKFLTVSELERLLNELYKAGQREYCLGLLLASTGMRISEVHSLSWSSFLEAPDGGVLIDVLRKGNSRQLIPLRNDVWQIIKEYMGKEIDNQDHSALFLNPSKRRASTVSLRCWIETAAKKAKIKKHVTPHVLRHTFCSLLLANNADLRSVQWVMNHKSITTTEVYAHPQNHKVAELLPLKLN